MCRYAYGKEWFFRANTVSNDEHTTEQIRVKLEHKKWHASGKHGFPGSRQE